MISGLVCAAIIYAAFYLAGLAVLGIGLAATIAASRISATRKHRDAIAEDERRGVANIIANCSVGTVAAVAELAHLELATDLTALWCVAGIAAGASDTVASEIGKAFGGPPRSFPTWQPVPPGTPGAVSVWGTLGGFAAATLIALPAPVLWLLPWAALTAIVVGCTVGAFVESALATTFEREGRMGNHMLNVINTLVAAAIATAWFVYGWA